MYGIFGVIIDWGLALEGDNDDDDNDDGNDDDDDDGDGAYRSRCDEIGDRSIARGWAFASDRDRKYCDDCDDNDDNDDDDDIDDSDNARGDWGDSSTSFNSIWWSS